MESIYSLVAKNKDLELRAIEADAKARENDGNLMKKVFLKLEPGKIKCRLTENEGGVDGLEGAIRDLQSQLQEQRDKTDEVDLELEEEIAKNMGCGV